MNFWGYKRPDGKVGIRNHILILPASICASDTTRIIASQVEGAITFNNQNGCSQVPPDMKLTMFWQDMLQIQIFTEPLLFHWDVKDARWIW